MGRSKIQRKCKFKPEHKSFCPKSINGTIELSSDEIEAIFLLDFQDMYQEDAAKQMDISRPTLSRIIKSARKKVASALILGYEIKVIDKKDDFYVALSINEEDNFSSISNFNQLIAIVKIKNCDIEKIEYIENPISKPNTKPSQILPKFLKDYKVNYWITNKIGEGLKNSLLANGIFIKIKNGFSSKEEIVTLFIN